MRARVLRDAGPPCALARDLGAGAAAALLVPPRARLGLPLGAPAPTRRGCRREPGRRQARRPGSWTTSTSTRGSTARCSSSGASRTSSSRSSCGGGLRDDPPLLGAGSGGDRRRQPARGAGPGRCDLPRARARARSRRRPPEAARRDARARDRDQRRARRLDERDVAGRPPDRLVRDRRRQHRGRDRGRAGAEEDDGRRGRRVLRRRHDEPGLRVRVPQLLPGAEAAARLHVREQRLRRVHAVRVGHRGRDPGPRRGLQHPGRDDRRHERVDGAGGRGASDRSTRGTAMAPRSSRR